MGSYTRPTLSPRARYEGIALILFLFAIPALVLTRWDDASVHAHPLIIRVLLSLLTLLWAMNSVRIGIDVVRLLRGKATELSGFTWVAVVVLSMSTFTGAASLGAAVVSEVPPAVSTHTFHLSPAAIPAGTGLLLSLAGLRRKNELADGREGDVDDDIALLRHYNENDISRLRTLLRDERDGVIDVTWPIASEILTPADEPLVAVRLPFDGVSEKVSFARVGGTLRIPSTYRLSDVTDTATSLFHGDIRVTETYDGLLRALASRTSHATVVIYHGREILDAEMRGLCIRTAAVDAMDFRELTWSTTRVRVELLRHYPVVEGLVEPFAANLRRRCIELVAYLALHSGDVVSGELLRDRVLGHDDAGATTRTLSNTASAARRSLGSDEKGLLLEPVSKAGLYRVRDVSCDVTYFWSLVSRARATPDAAQSLLHDALYLIKGEPLQAALRGFEWFHAEGFMAKLVRDAAWAGERLSDLFLEIGDTAKAAWALEQALLIDTWNQDLREKLRSLS